MKPRTAGDDPAVLDPFDQHVHGAVDRRGFLERAARLVGASAAAALLESLSPP